MNESARERILSTMNSALKRKSVAVPAPIAFPLRHWSPAERIEVLKRNLESVRSEVYLTAETNWIETLLSVLKAKRIKTLLYSPAVTIGKEITTLLKNRPEGLPEPVVYDGTIETFKSRLFEIDAAITTAKGAIAENGAIVLWPDPNEPRLMSLVPPIHIAVIRADTIVGSFAEVLENDRWTENMPTNAVLISGPSKTADIELVLTFGVHGPKELVVIIVD
jgi:L-lactate dehydrogenase complex protein LldG